MEVLYTEHGVFTENKVTGQTAEEVYQKWLEGRNKKVITNEERIEALEKALLEMILGGVD